jgi:cAMP-dependent protein kinase regulator
VAKKDPVKLREAAGAAVARGKLEAALALYAELEDLEPTCASWPKRIGETQRRLGNVDAAVVAFERAADKYLLDGLLVQAIGVCKLILSIAPHREAIAGKLAQLTSLPHARPRLPTDRPITLPHGGALDAVPLAVAMSDSTRVPRPDGSLSGISVLHIEIPLEDLDEEVEVLSPARLALQRTPLFAQVAQTTLERMISRMTLFEFAPGDVIFREGEPGTSLFVIADGEVSVEGGGHELGRLSPGAFFGELALVTDLPRSATVRAIGRVELLGLDRELVRHVAGEHPQIIQVLLRFMRERLVDRITRTSELFEPFTEDERHRLAEKFDVIEAEAGTPFIVQGQRADGLYVMMAGRVEVLRDGTTAPIATLGSGDVFGEISLLAGHGSTAHVRTASRVLALRMDAATFREVIMMYPQVLAYLGELSSRRSAPHRAEDFIDLHIDLV